MLPSQAGGFHAPAQRAADGFDAVGDDRLAVARAPKDYPALELSAGDGLRYWPNEERIIHQLFGVSPEISDAVAKFLQKVSDSFLVYKAGVVGADGNFHAMHFPEALWHAALNCASVY